MERKQSSSGMPSTSYQQQQQGSRSSVSGSSITNRSHMKTGARPGRKPGDKGDHPQVRVLDPDARDTDRTPLSLLRDAPVARPVKKRTKEQQGDKEGVTSHSGEEPSGDKGSVSRLESSDSGSESSRMDSSAESDGEESVAGMDRLALDDETSSMDSRLPEDKKKKGKSDGKSTSEETSEEAGLLSKVGGMGGRDTPRDRKGGKKAEEHKPRKEMTYNERQEWNEALETVTLCETETFFVLDRPDEQVWTPEGAPTDGDREEANARKERHERYVGMCDSSKNADKFVERGIVTFNEPHKNKETQFQPPAVGKSGTNTTLWDIADTMRQLEEEAEGGDDVALGVAGGDGGEGGGEGGVAVGDEGGGEMDDETTMMMADMDDGEGDEHRHDRHAKRKAWMNSSQVLTTLLQVERVLVHNIWQAEQLAYRGLHLENHIDLVEETKGRRDQGRSPPVGGGGPGHVMSNRDLRSLRTGDDPSGTPQPAGKRRGSGDEDEDSDDGARGESKMRVLWRFACSKTKEKNITCMSWNKANPDLLAVGYGDYGIPGTGANKDKRHDGLVCCWSLKNPVWPERIIEVPNAGVSAVGFSFGFPNLLAVGSTDGTLALYDVRKRTSTPALKSTVSTSGQTGSGQHTGTIWEVQWVQWGRDRGENLISIAADGRVKKWNIKKGLECTNLLRLKRSQGDATAAAGARKTGEAMLSRQSGGMCFDFNPTEPIQYIVGTEDGTVHKCNITNQEQYIADYDGHAGEPVYRVRWNPFCHQYFLTCSADWTARLWDERRTKEGTNEGKCILNFDSVHDAIQDTQWSPSNSCVFGTVTAQGRVDVYNMKESLEPAGSLTLDDRRLNCMQWAQPSVAQQDSAVLVVGDNRGEVTVIKLRGEEFERPPVDDQSDEFLRTVKKLTA